MQGASVMSKKNKHFLSIVIVNQRWSLKSLLLKITSLQGKVAMTNAEETHRENTTVKLSN